MPKAKAQKTKQRINMLISCDKYDLMQEQIIEGGFKTLTDLVVTRCTKAEPKQSVSSEILEIELKHAQEKLDKAEQDLKELKAQYNVTLNAMLWHSLPFWRKLGKQPQIAYNDHK